MAGLYDLIQKQDPYSSLDFIDPAAERRNKLAELMLTQSQSNPSWSNPLLALVGALQYGQGNNDTISAVRGKRTEFLKNAQAITQSNASPQVKISALLNLKASYGSDYGLGLDEYVKAYQEQSKPVEWKPASMQEALDFANAKNGNLEWKPTTQEEALNFEKAKKGVTGWKPATEEEALAFEKAKQGSVPVYKTDESGNPIQVGTVEKGSKFVNGTWSKVDPKAFERFNDALDPAKTVRTPLGIAKIAYDKAERLESLANAFPGGNLDSRQIEELAIGFNSLLQGGGGSGGGGSERIIQGLIPKSWVGDSLKIGEWLTNRPKGTKQQAFVKRMMGTVEREKATTAAQIKRIQYSRIAAFQKLQNKDPEQFDQVLMSWGIDPQEYQDWKASGYKQIDASKAMDTSSQQNNDYDTYLKAIGAK